MRRLAHQAEMRDSAPLRGVQEHRGDAGRAFVGWATVDAPGFDHRSPGGVGGARGDAYRTRVRRAGQERADRDDPPHAAALGHVEERLRVGAPPQMRLPAAKEQQAVPAVRWRASEELAPWPGELAALVGLHPHLGTLLGEHEKVLGVDPGQPRGGEVADRWRKAPVAAWPASIQPPNAITSVV